MAMNTEKKQKNQALAKAGGRRFMWTTAPIPHTARRRLILEKHPEIADLNGCDMREGVLATCLILFQLFVASHADSMGWMSFLLATYFISATLNHFLFTGLHDLSHNAIWPKQWMNEAFAIVSNIPMGIPSAIEFWRYHLDHHAYFGVDKLDPDLPTELEAKLFRRPLQKLVWLLMLPITYTLRPILRSPKAPTFLTAVNVAFIATTDYIIYRVWGPSALAYCVCGALASMSIHPFAGHFISEHYQFPEGEEYQETWSYYGWMNMFTFNVGYHNEHHDFPLVPGWKLPEVRRIAKEFYDLPVHESWTQPIVDFITDDRMSCFSRVKRTAPRGGALPEHHRDSKFHEGDTPKNAFWSGPVASSAS